MLRTHLPLDEILVVLAVLPPLAINVLINVPPLRELDPLFQLGQIHEAVVVPVDLVHDNAVEIKHYSLAVIVLPPTSSYSNLLYSEC